VRLQLGVENDRKLFHVKPNRQCYASFNTTIPHVMNLIKLPFTAIVLVASHAPAAESQQFPFVHHDWEIACDNTRTCRAAGYQADDAERGVSIY
jgi:hypothetical protein